MWPYSPVARFYGYSAVHNVIDEINLEAQGLSHKNQHCSETASVMDDDVSSDRPAASVFERIEAFMWFAFEEIRYNDQFPVMFGLHCY